MLNRLFHLIIKEFLALLRDPKTRGILIVPPILQIFIFSYAITQDVKNVSLAVLNHDTGVESGTLIQRFQQSPTFTRIISLSHRGEIDSAIDKQQAMIVLVIPQDFSRNLYGGRVASVQVLLDGRKSNAAPIVGSYATKIVNKFVQERSRTAQNVGVDIQTRHWFNSNLEPKRTTIPCLVCILATVLGMLVSGLSIAREREMGTFEQILVSPLTPTEILLGKAIPALVLATGSSMILIMIAVFIMGIPLQGSFWLLLASLDLFLLSVIGIGLFISSLSATQQQAILGVILILPPSIMLSGFATPVETMPNWMQWLTVANPVRWYLVIVKGVFMKGMDAYEVFLNCVPLAAISLITLCAASTMFRRRME
ncbi:MAG: ABC transporter permease [Planctomycetaceae bacterium]|jgi:ABC-2 type transport system permease protein|nr:ABC transporter permease [Planctomycetaceae bacterium]